MTPRQRVTAALEHGIPDRVPMDFGGTDVSGASREMMGKIRRVLGLTEGPDPQFPYFDDAIQKHLGVDFRAVYLNTLDGSRRAPGASFEPVRSETDEWGIANYANESANPLRGATRADLEKYPWPDPHDPRRVEGIREYAKYLHSRTDYAIVAQHFIHGLVEGGLRLRGYDQFLMDLALDQDFIRALLEKMLELARDFIDAYLGEVGEFIQLIWIGDDACTQRGPYMSPEMYRKLVKPYFAEYVKAIRSRTDAKVMLHCCGSCVELIPDFIDIGIDVLTPLQPEPSGMDHATLKRDFGDQLAFHGGIGLQKVLTRGTTRDVERAVRDAFAALGDGGGYILAAAHSLPDDVPPENVVALFEAGRSCAYPTT